MAMVALWLRRAARASRSIRSRFAAGGRAGVLNPGPHHRKYYVKAGAQSVATVRADLSERGAWDLGVHAGLDARHLSQPVGDQV